MGPRGQVTVEFCQILCETVLETIKNWTHVALRFIFNGSWGSLSCWYCYSQIPAFETFIWTGVCLMLFVWLLRKEKWGGRVCVFLCICACGEREREIWHLLEIIYSWNIRDRPQRVYNPSSSLYTWAHYSRDQKVNFPRSITSQWSQWTWSRSPGHQADGPLVGAQGGEQERCDL